MVRGARINALYSWLYSHARPNVGTAAIYATSATDLHWIDTFAFNGTTLFATSNKLDLYFTQQMDFMANGTTANNNFRLLRFDIGATSYMQPCPPAPPAPPAPPVPPPHFYPCNGQCVAILTGWATLPLGLCWGAMLAYMCFVPGALSTKSPETRAMIEVMPQGGSEAGGRRSG